MMPEETRKAREIKKKYESDWLSIGGVTAVGVGIDNGQVSIVVSVESDPETIRTHIPSKVEGIPVVIIESGEIKAH